MLGIQLPFWSAVPVITTGRWAKVLRTVDSCFQLTPVTLHTREPASYIRGERHDALSISILFALKRMAFLHTINNACAGGAFNRTKIHHSKVTLSPKAWEQSVGKMEKPRTRGHLTAFPSRWCSLIGETGSSKEQEILMTLMSILLSLSKPEQVQFTRVLALDLLANSCVPLGKLLPLPKSKLPNP